MVRLLLAAFGAAVLVLPTPAAAQPNGISDPPVALRSIQHFWAILKRCETIVPDRNAIRAREAAFDGLLDDAKAADGLWRTFVDADGRAKETQFRSARDMVYSLEFAADVKRYEQVVAMVPLTIQVQDCREFASLVEQALSGK
jgi:hypothetical protein